MTKLRVLSFAVSIDGFSAGPNQDLQNPLGVNGSDLMEWFFHTHAWRKMHGHDDGETGIDNGIAERAFAGIGAWILGRNMFGPVRGPWPVESALKQAKAAAGDRDVRLGGGVDTVRQYLRARLIDELHLAVRPVLLGSGEQLFNGIDMRALGYECATSVAGERATHVYLRKRA